MMASFFIPSRQLPSGLLFFFIRPNSGRTSYIYNVAGGGKFAKKIKIFFDGINRIYRIMKPQIYTNQISRAEGRGVFTMKNGRTGRIYRYFRQRRYAVTSYEEPGKTAEIEVAKGIVEM
jgi:hypothetical protein